MLELKNQNIIVLNPKELNLMSNFLFRERLVKSDYIFITLPNNKLKILKSREDLTNV